MKYTPQKLVEEYYKSLNTTEFTLEEVKEIVTTPFKALKKDMEEAIFSTFRLKYLGTFLIYKKRAVTSLKRLKIKHDKKEVKEFEKLSTKIQTYIDEQ